MIEHKKDCNCSLCNDKEDVGWLPLSYCLEHLSQLQKMSSNWMVKDE